MSANDKYLIVTTDALKNSLASLVAQKSARAYNVITMTCEELDRRYPDRYLPDAIRSFAQDALMSVRGRSCLLLAGDKESVPGYPLLSASDGLCHYFVRTADNKVAYSRYYYANGWLDEHAHHPYTWTNKDGAIVSDPAAIAWCNNRIDVFGRGADNHLKHTWFSGGWAANWEDKGGNLASDPVVISRRKGCLDIFARTPANHLAYLRIDQNGWSAWLDLGGDLRSKPAVVSCQKNGIDVFSQDGANRVARIHFDGNNWGAWENLGGSAASAPAAVSSDRGKIDVFTRGADNHLKQLSFRANAWGAWQDRGGDVPSDFTAVSIGTESVFVAMRANNGHLKTIFCDNGVWAAWEDKGGSITSIPTVISWAGKIVSVFARGTDGELQHIKYNGVRWGGWEERDAAFVGNVSLSSWKDLDSDVYFSMANANDIKPALLTGRLSTNDPVVMTNICNFLVSYPQDHDKLWQGRAILTGWLPRGTSDPAAQRLEDPGWACTREIGDYFEIDKQFEHLDDARRDTLAMWGALDSTTQSLADAINKGALVVRYVGHGTTDGWANIGHNESFLTGDVNKLDVKGKTPFVISGACLTGDIETSVSFAEKWQTQLKAVGVFASDAVASIQFDMVTQRMFRNIVRNKEQRIGDIINDSLQQFRNELPANCDVGTAQMFRYFGDPDTLLPITRTRSEQDAAVCWGRGRLDIFSKGAANSLMHLWYQRQWGHWESKEGLLASGPAVVSWGSGRLDIFARSEAGTLMHLWFGNERWGAWEDKGGTLASAPAAVSWAQGRLDIFALNAAGNLMHLWYDRNGWGRWENKGGELAGKPAVISRGRGKLDIFCRGKNNHFWYLSYDANGWGAWHDAGGEILSDPAACSWAAGRFDVFAVAPNGNLKHIACENGRWGAWENKGGSLTHAPSVLAGPAGVMDIFARGQNGHLQHLPYRQRWQAWVDRGGLLINQPCAVAWAPGRIDIFSRDDFNHQMHIWSENGRWGDWEDKTPNLRQEWIC